MKQKMAGKMRKLTSLAIAFMLVCLVAEGILQFYVVTPPVVLASPAETTVVPNAQHARDNTTEALSEITGDDSAVNPDALSKANAGDNTYTVDGGNIMHLDTFDVSSIPDGSTITAAVLHLEYGAEDGYGGTNPVHYDNGLGLTTTGITPTDITGWSPDLTFDLYNAGVNTKSEIQNVDIEFTSNDPPADDAIHFDYVWITVTYTPPAVEKSVTQGITITDGVTTAVVAARDVSQGITITDGVTAAVGRARDVSQGITITDGVTVAVGRVKDISQTLSLTATTSAEASFSRSVSQSIAITDEVTATPSTYRSATQGITLSDGVTAAVERGRDVSQTLSITATTCSGVCCCRSVSQGIAITDGVTGAAKEVTATESILVSDIVSRTRCSLRNIEETIPLSDAITVAITRGKVRPVRPVGPVGPVGPVEYTVVISETLAVSENITVNFNMVVGETLAISENIKVNVEKAPTSRWIYVALSIFCALVVLLAVAKAKFALFIRRIVSLLIHTALPKFRALVTLLAAARVKIALSIRRIVSLLIHTALPKFHALVALLAAARVKIALFIRRIISYIISHVKH